MTLTEAVQTLNLRFPVAELSEKLDYNKGTISTYLTGRQKPSEPFKRKFEKIFGIDIRNNGPTIADIIIKRVIETNKTAYQIAKETNLTEVGVSKILKGETKNPNQSTLETLKTWLDGDRNKDQEIEYLKGQLEEAREFNKSLILENKAIVKEFKKLFNQFIIDIKKPVQ